jgi:hypothetical protein
VGFEVTGSRSGDDDEAHTLARVAPGFFRSRRWGGGFAAARRWGGGFTSQPRGSREDGEPGAREDEDGKK